jgi:hypothetical protein
MKTDNAYAHRLNGDGSFDSICLRCFTTVATADTIENLAPNETAHKCADDHLDRQRKSTERRDEPFFGVHT